MSTDNMSKATKASARVQLTIEVDAGCGWGHDATVAQVYKQAAESALGNVYALIGSGKARLIGEPRVVAVFAEESA